MNFYLSRKKKKQVNRKKLENQLSEVTKLARNALINHDAYVQADADRKNLDIAKYRNKITAKISEESDEEGANSNDVKTSCLKIMSEQYK